MWTEIYSMVDGGTELDLKIKAGQNGTLKVFVMPVLGKGGIPSMATPLVLDATPAELDEGFAQAIANYQSSRGDLAAQVAITASLLAAAKQEQKATAVKAIKGKGTTPSKSTSNTDDEDEDDDEATSSADDSATGEVAIAPSSPAAESAPAEVSASNDLLSLID